MILKYLLLLHHQHLLLHHHHNKHLSLHHPKLNLLNHHHHHNTNRLNLLTPQNLLNTLMEKCATMTQKVAQLEQDKVAQALEIVKLKQRVRKLEKKRKTKHSGLKRLRKVELDADEDVTPVDVDTAVEIDVDTQGRMEEDVTAVKEVNAAEPIVFDDEEVTMTMAQTLIKMKAEKQRILDEQMAKRLQDKEIEQVAARERQEKQDLERAKVLQQQYDQKQEYIDWNIVAEQMQEKFDQSLKESTTMFKPFLLDTDEEPSKKRVAKETLLQESFKKLRAEVEVSGSSTTQQEETPTVDTTEISKEDVQNMLTYWRMIRVGGITQVFQSFKDMLKDFVKEDLDALRRITKEKFSTAMPTHVKEKALWVELTRLYEPNADDVF
nr:hypothetical protein [Tanacetum cinerariifolium]